ncbi:helix-turn-helix domain-containing protein [Flavobacterium sandaracinum]|uniref:Transposase n=3 Tax=Flavobacterium sandaracinum TaxID=2541733 RepID=A0A4R5CY08_9FLAO|nr:helix-turn-helix domain-containing protein [Flavobacterium sandaracinum]TDE03991.1 transposase [Flavobacterium sandaracinum]
MERKVKYEYTFKLECVELVIKQHNSCVSVANKKMVHRSSIKKWVRLYNYYGEDGLIPRKNRSYSDAFKFNVLQSIQKDSLSLLDSCLKFDIPDAGIVLKWKKDFINFGFEGLKQKTRGRSKPMSNFKRKKRKSDKPLTNEEKLLQEIEYLRCENDLLKKFHALIQAEEQAKKRKL